MIQIPFSKYSGCGNDFVLVDNRSSFFPLSNGQLLRTLCHRREGIGADGVILLETSQKADFRMRIFNADASEAEMCGNGIRCLMHFINKLMPAIDHCTAETVERLIPLKLSNGLVTAGVGEAKDIRWDLEAPLPSTTIDIHYLNTGVPHCVAFVPCVASFDLKTIGPQLRNHALFGPKGTNVNVALADRGKVRYRTFERGVEDETPACGTGAVAVALATAYQMHWSSPITVETSSNQELIIAFERCGDLFTGVTMTGPAKHIFDGFYNTIA